MSLNLPEGTEGTRGIIWGVEGVDGPLGAQPGGLFYLCATSYLNLIGCY
jgi:hypothetical protein